MADVITVPGAALDEEARLAALYACEILDTLPESAFEDLVELAQRACGTPAAAISFIDSDRQWLKAARGIAQGVAREHAFCNHTIQGDETLIVTDATKDARFSSNPYVAGEFGVRFYAGAPLVTSEGARVGALCVLDRQPRTLDREQVIVLEILARQVAVQLETRRQKAALEEALAARDAAIARGELSRGLRTAVGGAANLEEAASGAIASLCAHFGWTGGTFWRVDRPGAPLALLGIHGPSTSAHREFWVACRSTPFPLDVGLPGRVWRTREPLWLESFTQEPSMPRLSAARSAGLASAMGVPVFDGGTLVGVLELLHASEMRRNDAIAEGVAHAASELYALMVARFGPLSASASRGEVPFDPARDLRLELVLSCSAEHVWRGYTDPALLVQWFCPRPWVVASCDLDCRPGGRFHTLMRGPAGEQHADDGCFLELVPNRRVVWTTALLDGFRTAPEHAGPRAFVFTASVSFETVERGTRVVAVVSHRSCEDRDLHARMGFEAGWSAAFEQLSALARG